MWSYFGAKTNLVDLYPKPIHDKIIEPFAGSARYALKYFDRDILLVDKYEVIVRIWKWLQQCSPNDILKLPRLKQGQSTTDFVFDCEEAKWFLGFIIGSGPERPRIKAPDRKTIQRPNHSNFGLKRCAGELWKIKHWKIELGTYSDIPNQEATWFIDPPYQHGGATYVHSNKHINFPELGNWSMDRMGQTIVCENTKADWMDFKSLSKQRGSESTTEAIWCNMPTVYDNEQLTLKI